MCSRICKHNYRITIIVKIGYRDHSPAGLVVTGVPLARDDMHSPRATGRPLSIHPGIVQFLVLLAILRNSNWTFQHLLIFFSHKVGRYDLMPINSYIFGPLSSSSSRKYIISENDYKKITEAYDKLII